MTREEIEKQIVELQEVRLKLLRAETVTKGQLLDLNNKYEDSPEDMKYHTGIRLAKIIGELK